jgi:hypothetical protein
MMDSDDIATVRMFFSRMLSVKSRMSFVADPQGTYHTVNNEIWNPKTEQWLPWTVGNVLEATKGES